MNSNSALQEESIENSTEHLMAVNPNSFDEVVVDNTERFMDKFPVDVLPTNINDAEAPNDQEDDEETPPILQRQTGVGVVMLLEQRHGRNIRFNCTMNKFVYWNGKMWELDTSGHVLRCGQETATAILEDALKHDDPDYIKYAKKTECRGPIITMVKLLGKQKNITVESSTSDADPMVLNVNNGILSLLTQTLEPHRREAYCTKLAPVDFLPDANCPRFAAFLERIFEGDQEVISYIQRIFGYMLSGNTKEQVMFILYGDGANGKSTLIDVMMDLLGDYSRQADFTTFLASNSNRIRNDIARLDGARCVSAVEGDRDRRLDEAIIKQLTGGDRITARFLRQEYFEFIPQFKLVLASNNKPRIRGSDNGIWRRIHLIPFNVHIPENERNPNLKAELHSEMSGILNWALAGFAEWQCIGLAMPETVKAATDAYRAEMDEKTRFINEMCVEENGAEVSATELYQAYRQDCLDEGGTPDSQKKFGAYMTKSGYEKERRPRMTYIGIKLGSNTASAAHDTNNS
jgi:putative DNA primase/helicase